MKYKMFVTQSKKDLGVRIEGAKIGLKNLKLTSSKTNLHKTNQAIIRITKDFYSTKNLNLSKEKQSEIDHEQKIAAELERFRKTIERKFKGSTANREYRFPRDAKQPLVEDSGISNCMFALNP